MFDAALELVMGNIDTMKVWISIDTSGTDNDKYWQFPLHENSEKICGNFEKILEENGKILKYVILVTF